GRTVTGVQTCALPIFTAQEKLGDSFHYLKRQSIAALIGLFAMATAMRLGYRRMARLAWPLLLVALLLLIAVLFPGVGVVVNGARSEERRVGKEGGVGG